MRVRHLTCAETIMNELRVAAATLRSRGGVLGAEVADTIEELLAGTRKDCEEALVKIEAKRKDEGVPYDREKHLWPVLAAELLLLDNLRDRIREVIEASPQFKGLGIVLSRRFSGGTEVVC